MPMSEGALPQIPTTLEDHGEGSKLACVSLRISLWQLLNKEHLVFVQDLALMSYTKNKRKKRCYERLRGALPKTKRYQKSLAGVAQ